MVSNNSKTADMEIPSLQLPFDDIAATDGRAPAWKPFLQLDIMPLRTPTQ